MRRHPRQRQKRTRSAASAEPAAFVPSGRDEDEEMARSAAQAVPECAYGERTYTVARPAFFQTSVLVVAACATVGEVTFAQASKADMVPAGTGRQCPRHRLGEVGRGLAGSGHGRTAPALLAGRIRRTAIADRAEKEVRGPARLPICPARQERSSFACAHPDLTAGGEGVPRRRGDGVGRVMVEGALEPKLNDAGRRKG